MLFLDNHKKGEPLELTQKQIIGIVLKLNHISKETGEEKSYGYISKNGFWSYLFKTNYPYCILYLFH